MSRKCLDVCKFKFNRLKSGSRFCSLILLFSFFTSLTVLNAQSIAPQPLQDSINNNIPQEASSNNISALEKANISLSDVDADGLNDITYENNKIKIVISSRTGTINFYYLKGKSYSENFYPPQIAELGYVFDKNSLKVFNIDTPEHIFSETNYNIELEQQNKNESIIKVTANISKDINENTPDYKALSLVRRFIIPNDSYSIKIENTVTNLKEKPIVVGNDKEGALTFSYGPGIFLEPYGQTTLIGLKNAEDPEFFTSVDSLNKKGLKAGDYFGIGIKDQYFCVLMEFEKQEGIITTEQAKNQYAIQVIASQTRSVNEQKRAMDTRVLNCIVPKFTLGSKESKEYTLHIYAGPMILDELKKINKEKVAKVAWLSSLMMATLRYLYKIIPNYGIAIILLTLIVRALLIPLTLKQSKEMAKMQKIQPKVKDIQTKYKDDPQKMNEEIMKLYTKNHVNPLGGCLPLIVQLPIIMALFESIRGAVELRKAPFLWLSDLSKGDPYLILPIAITALMYYQQSKTNVDPQQRQAMAFMPMMMFFITFQLPSGLLVYWFASSVLGILQQLHANRIMASMKEEY